MVWTSTAINVLWFINKSAKNNILKCLIWKLYNKKIYIYYVFHYEEKVIFIMYKIIFKIMRLIQHSLIGHRKKLHFMNYYWLNFNSRSKLSKASFSKLTFRILALVLSSRKNFRFPMILFFHFQFEWILNFLYPTLHFQFE